MSPFFFQKFWHIIGGDVTETVLSVLNSGHVLNKMNFTHILLIPKKKDPQCMADYWPISLSNVVSRIVSKVLANRVKPILPNIISDSQSALIPNRLILDNTSVAYEMLHRLRNRRQGKVGHMAIKLESIRQSRMGVFSQDNAQNGVLGQVGKSGHARCILSKLLGAHQWRTSRSYPSNTRNKTGWPAVTIFIPVLRRETFQDVSQVHWSTAHARHHVLPKWSYDLPFTVRRW